MNALMHGLRVVLRQVHEWAYWGLKLHVNLSVYIDSWGTVSEFYLILRTTDQKYKCVAVF